MAEPDVRWHQMRGGITREHGPEFGGRDYTVFSLQVAGPRGPWGCRIEVETERLARVPGLYKRTLDLMVRDIQARL